MMHVLTNGAEDCTIVIVEEQAVICIEKIGLILWR